MNICRHIYLYLTLPYSCDFRSPKSIGQVTVYYCLSKSIHPWAWPCLVSSPWSRAECFGLPLRRRPEREGRKGSLHLQQLSLESGTDHGWPDGRTEGRLLGWGPCLGRDRQRDNTKTGIGRRFIAGFYRSLAAARPRKNIWFKAWFFLFLLYCSSLPRLLAWGL